jgi:hypothetical protein
MISREAADFYIDEFQTLLDESLQKIECLRRQTNDYVCTEQWATGYSPPLTAAQEIEVWQGTITQYEEEIRILEASVDE